MVRLFGPPMDDGNSIQDTRRRNPTAEKRHTDPEDVYVKQEKIGISKFSQTNDAGQGSFGSVYKG